MNINVLPKMIARRDLTSFVPLSPWREATSTDYFIRPSVRLSIRYDMYENKRIGGLALNLRLCPIIILLLDFHVENR